MQAVGEQHLGKEMDKVALERRKEQQSCKRKNSITV
jgi:hypothetical protein